MSIEIQSTLSVIDYLSFAGSSRNGRDKAIEAILEIKNMIETYCKEEAAITEEYLDREMAESIAEVEEQLSAIWESWYLLEAHLKKARDSLGVDSQLNLQQLINSKYLWLHINA